MRGIKLFFWPSRHTFYTVTYSFVLMLWHLGFMCRYTWLCWCVLFYAVEGEIPPAFRGRPFTHKLISSRRSFYKRDGKACKQPARGFRKQWSVSSRWSSVALFFFSKMHPWEASELREQIRAQTCSSAPSQRQIAVFLSALFSFLLLSFLAVTTTYATLQRMHEHQLHPFMHSSPLFD